jgi:hypothetical protein
MKRLNPETNKPFKQGEQREDGYYFSCYLLNKTDGKGYYLERWYSPGTFKKYKTKANELNCKNNKKKREERKKYIDDLKLSRKCFDCGYNKHSEALQFDHLPGKRKSFAISKGILKPLSEVLKEIEKCQVVCACCHAIRTHNRRTE